jgi:branched-subunit amino acid transport protein
MTTWLTILAVAAGTYGFRVSMFVLLGRRSLPAWTAQPIALIAPAAIGALVASMLFGGHSGPDLPELAEISAVVAGFAAVRRTGNVLHAFAVGLPVFWVIHALLG